VVAELHDLYSIEHGPFAFPIAPETRHALTGRQVWFVDFHPMDPLTKGGDYWALIDTKSFAFLVDGPGK
jgi:hypothetical protein